MSILGHIFGSPAAASPTTNNKSEYGDDSNADPKVLKSSLLEDLASLGTGIPADLKAVVETIDTKLTGEMDDKKLTMEGLIKLVAALPRTSSNRELLTGKLIDGLWDTLQHPPLSYVGPKYQYRQADGSHNNIMHPQLGAAGQPYARSVRGEKRLAGAKPDPGLLFDLLMSRGPTTKEHPSGLSSMLFYHASLIIHDVFRTSRNDPSVSDTSSYLDLAPLYGSSVKDQAAIRTFSGGRLHADTFAEERLLGHPPGVCVLLVMYSRFHNHVASQLAQINEGGRFSPARGLDPEKAAAAIDEDLFQTARLVTCGLYINISVHDYIRAIANIPHSTSDWTLDPRVHIKDVFDAQGVPRGVGNQVSCEFNLLYRFHSAISARDERWTADFYRRLWPGTEPHEVTFPMFLQGLRNFEAETLACAPSKREFGGLERDAKTGAFADEELVRILKESIEDTAGAFGANNVPDLMRHVEVLGIVQARRWQVGSLNEFRKFFGLRTHKTFADINPDPYVSSTLEKLYDHPDLVELYPGLFLESTKPRMDPGIGICAPYTVSRAVLSDAVTLVRGDRFYTLDFTSQNLTSWGFATVAPDYDVVGGGKMNMLIQTAFPSWFKANSVYALQPFFTPAENHKIFEAQGKLKEYSFDPPSLHKHPLPVVSHAGVTAVLKDPTQFKVPWGPALDYIMDGNYFMLMDDSPRSAKQRKSLMAAIYDMKDYTTFFKVETEKLFLEILRRESYSLGSSTIGSASTGQFYQVDFARDIANVIAVRFAADLFKLPLKLESKGRNGQFSERELYNIFGVIQEYCFFDIEPLKTLKRRKLAKERTAALGQAMEHEIGAVHQTVQSVLSGGFLASVFHPAEHGLQDYGESVVKKLLEQGVSRKETAWLLISAAVGLVGNSAQAFVQITDFYLRPENAQHLAAIQALARQPATTNDDKLQRYALEAYRLANTIGVFRVVDPKDPTKGVTINGPDGKPVTLKKGDTLFTSFTAAGLDPTVFPDPHEIRLDRPLDSYLLWGEGPHKCLGGQINMVQMMTLLKVVGRLENLRRAPGDEGRLKTIRHESGAVMYMNADWSNAGPYPCSMRVQFDGWVGSDGRHQAAF